MKFKAGDIVVLVDNTNTGKLLRSRWVVADAHENQPHRLIGEHVGDDKAFIVDVESLVPAPLTLDNVDLVVVDKASDTLLLGDYELALKYCAEKWQDMPPLSTIQEPGINAHKMTAGILVTIGDFYRFLTNDMLSKIYEAAKCG